MPYTPEHPAEWTLELFAEDALPASEQAKAAAHIARCSRCADEVQAFRSLFSTISSLPKFAPEPAFSDAVMTRVRIAQGAPAWAWLTSRLPATRRGWTLLLGVSLAPALPLIALFAWLFSQTALTPVELWELARLGASDFGWAVLVNATGFMAESRLFAWAGLLIEQLYGVPLEILAGTALVFGVGIPLSAWTLYRTLRAPDGESTYAH